MVEWPRAGPSVPSPDFGPKGSRRRGMLTWRYERTTGRADPTRPVPGSAAASSGSDPWLGRQPQLDGMRALYASSLIVAYHCWGLKPQGGFIGVDVFFVISGYLITTILLREHRTSAGIGLRKFYERRALRLFPTLVIVLGFVGAFYVAAKIFVGARLYNAGSTNRCHTNQPLLHVELGVGLEGVLLARGPGAYVVAVRRGALLPDLGRRHCCSSSDALRIAQRRSSQRRSRPSPSIASCCWSWAPQPSGSTTRPTPEWTSSSSAVCWPCLSRADVCARCHGGCCAL